ncbi:MAG: hypothetical protein Q8P67_12025 [archaeon]|nr:hypothetical protein [archaeon]
MKAGRVLAFSTGHGKVTAMSEKKSDRLFAGIYFAAALFSLVLMAVGAAKNPAGMEIPATIVRNSSLDEFFDPYNSTVLNCGTNDNTQVFCTAISFSIICGTCGVILGMLAFYNRWTNQTTLNTVGLAIFLCSAFAIALGLWIDVVVVSQGDNGLSNANFAMVCLAGLS